MRSYGNVGSYFETDLTPQVSGKITFVSPKFRVGETVDTEHLLVQIDPTDYRAALATAEANLTVAERTFEEEKIRAEQAAGDWEAWPGAFGGVGFRVEKTAARGGAGQYRFRKSYH